MSIFNVHIKPKYNCVCESFLIPHFSGKIRKIPKEESQSDIYVRGWAGRGYCLQR